MLGDISWGGSRLPRCWGAVFCREEEVLTLQGGTFFTTAYTFRRFSGETPLYPTVPAIISADDATECLSSTAGR